MAIAYIHTCGRTRETSFVSISLPVKSYLSNTHVNISINPKHICIHTWKHIEIHSPCHTHTNIHI